MPSYDGAERERDQLEGIEGAEVDETSEVSDDRAEDRPDPRLRPDDPVGTKPRFDPATLLPADKTPLRSRPSDIEGTAFEEDDADLEADDELLPEMMPGIRSHGTLAASAGGSSSRYAPRFQFVLGAFLAVAATALVGFAAILVRHHDHHSVTVATAATTAASHWSSWMPAKGAGDTTAQIAAHVGPEYKLPDGKQLTLVTGTQLSYGGAPLPVALQETGAQGGQIKVVGAKAAIYHLCGLGPRCEISDGKPSIQRGLLVQREALELALYTFRYTDADSVVATFPYNPKVKGTHALFFTPTILASALDHPLTQTLTPAAPSVTDIERAKDTPAVKAYTQNLLFDYNVSVSDPPNAEAFLVLRSLTG